MTYKVVGADENGVFPARVQNQIAELIRDTMGTALVAGSNVTLTVNDVGDTITVASSGGGTTDPEVVRDTMATALVAGSNVTITPNDVADTITIAASVTGSGNMKIFSGDSSGATSVNSAMATDAAAAVAAGIPLWVPPGNFQITTGLATLPAGLHMIIDANARFFRSSTGNMFVLASNTIIEGGMIECAGSGSAAIKIAASASNITVYNVKLQGASGAQIFYIDATGISDVTVDKCRFTTGSYGFLVNSSEHSTGAYDLRNVKITGCSFDSFTADPIEFNHPNTLLAPLCGDYKIDNCTFTNPLGTSTSAGFAIGFAGAGDVVVSNNVITARREAIHFEDGCVNYTVTGNIIKSVSGTGSQGGIVVYHSFKGVIDGNIVNSVDGTGIYVIYDAATVLSEDLIVTNNIVRSPTGIGIYVAADKDEGGRFYVAGNIVRGAGSDGIKVAGDMEEGIVHNNFITQCAEYGIGIEANGGVAARLRSFKGNVITQCTLGDYEGIPIASGNATNATTRSIYVRGATSGAGTDSVATLFRLGRYAQGYLTVQARRVGSTSNKADTVWYVRWDGTTFVARRVHSSASGTVSLSSTAGLSMVNGVLTATVAVGATSTQADVTATFDGVCYEDLQTFTGTVASTPITITGSRGGNAALASLLTEGAKAGYWTDSSTA